MSTFEVLFRQKHWCSGFVLVDVVVVAAGIQSRVVDRTNALPRYHLVWFPKVCGSDHRLVHSASALFPSRFR